MRLKAAGERLMGWVRGGLWFWPGLCILGAVALSTAALKLDDQLGKGRGAFYLFAGGPEGARAVLSTIAASMMTFTGVVFSVTVLVLQLASSQFSPRVLRTFFRDRPNQLVLGLFAGTFLYALLALRNVRSASQTAEAQVPAFSVWIAVVLAAVSIGAFVFFLHHIAQSIRAVKVLQRIGEETRTHLDRLFPEGLGDPSPRPVTAPLGDAAAVVVHFGRPAVVVAVDEAALWTLATRNGVSIAMCPGVGEFVRRGRPLFEVFGDAQGVDYGALASTLRWGSERSLEQDAAFGLRQIVDIAERALSPGINDPSTAVQALDQLDDLLARLIRRRFPSPDRLDERGVVRLRLPRPDWETYLGLAVDEIRHYGGGSLQVNQRLRRLLIDLLRLAPDERRASIEIRLKLVEESVGRHFPAAFDVELAAR